MSSDRIFQQLDRIETKIDKATDRLGRIDSTLAAQHEQIVIHIKRTDLLERELKPISKHVQQMHGAAKFIGLVAVVAGIVAGLAVFWGK